MKPISVEDIPIQGLSVDLRLDETWLKERTAETPLGFDTEGPLQMFGELSKISQGIIFRGKVKGRIKLSCGRCLEGFIKDIEERVEAEWRLIPQISGTARSAKDLSQTIEDLESGEIQGGGLNLAERILEEVILSIPIQPLCRITCQGLCPTCGANRNVSPCNCRLDGPPHPFADLMDVKIETQERPKGSRKG